MRCNGNVGHWSSQMQHSVHGCRNGHQAVQNPNRNSGVWNFAGGVISRLTKTKEAFSWRALQLGSAELLLSSVDENYDNGEAPDAEVTDGVLRRGGWAEMWIGCEINTDKGWRRWVSAKGFCCLGVMASSSRTYHTQRSPLFWLGLQLLKVFRELDDHADCLTWPSWVSRLIWR